jgi:hypothetical protein
MNLLKALFQKKVMAKCGHMTRMKGRLRSGKESISIELKLSDGRPAHCLDCLNKMSILCARCGRPIFVGDPISVLLPRGWTPHEQAVACPDYPGLITCVRSDCTPIYCVMGAWWPEGRIRYHFPDPERRSQV